MNLITKLLIAAILALGTFAFFTLSENKRLKEDISDKTINIKALENGVVQYRDRDSSLVNRQIEMRKTIADFKYSSDSTIRILSQALIATGIKLKDVQRIGIQASELSRDTTIIINNTVKEHNRVYDFSREPWLTNVIKVNGDSVSNKLRVRDSLITVAHAKKETIEPRKKFFIARWFQPRHIVVYQDSKNLNPLVELKGGKTYTIVK